jgi:hypothetical protein
MFKTSIPFDFIDVAIRAYQKDRSLFLAITTFTSTRGNWITQFAFSFETRVGHFVVDSAATEILTDSRAWEDNDRNLPFECVSIIL